MTRRALASVLVLAAGCVEVEGPGLACDADEECVEGERCLDGTCAPYHPPTAEELCAAAPCETVTLDDGNELVCDARSCPAPASGVEPVCAGGACCAPACAGRACGDGDGCGGTCTDGCPRWQPVRFAGAELTGDRAFPGIALEPAADGGPPAIVMTGGLSFDALAVGDFPVPGTFALPLAAPLAWSRLDVAVEAPEVFDGSALAPPGRGSVVHLGGYLVGGSSTMELRELVRDPARGGPTWSLVAPEGPSPADVSPRGAACVAYDEARDEVVVFGGGATEGLGEHTRALGDTWVWTNPRDPGGARWEDRTDPDGPSARQGAACAWDGEGVVLFGGVLPPARLFAETWRWDGARWSLLAPAGAVPSSRHEHAMAWEPAGRRVILFGGSDTREHLEETWEWRRPEGAPAHRWVRYPVGAGTSPGPRAGVGLVAIPPGSAPGTPLEAGGVVLAGGRVSRKGYFGDLWVLPPP